MANRQCRAHYLSASKSAAQSSRARWRFVVTEREQIQRAELVRDRQHRHREEARVRRAGFFAPMAASPPARPWAFARWTTASLRRAGISDGTGTPSTGTVVLAASMPGRCAAPPAPAMITRMPRSLASAAYSNMSSGVRWADTTFCFVVHAKSGPSISTACLCDVPTEEEPITTPYRGAPRHSLRSAWARLAVAPAADRNLPSPST